MNPTLTIALAGLALSGIAIGWNVYRDLTDRGQLRVGCKLGYIVVPGGPADETLQLIWRVTNIGRRPVVVESVGGAKARGFLRRIPKEDGYFILSTRNPLPIVLDPGVSLHESTANLSVLDDLKYVAAWDSLDRVYKANRRQLKALKRERREGVARDPQAG